MAEKKSDQRQLLINYTKEDIPANSLGVFLVLGLPSAAILQDLNTDTQEKKHQTRKNQVHQ